VIAGPVSGAGVNPARAIAPMILAGQFSDWWAYLAARWRGCGSYRPLRQVPACRQHACLAMTPAHDDLSQAAERRDCHHARLGLAAAGRMPACWP